MSEVVRSRGDGLPEEFRRAFLRRMPESELLTKLAVKYSDGSSQPRGQLDQKLEEWRAMWDAGIREVVEVYRERQRVAREYWENQS